MRIRDWTGGLDPHGGASMMQKRDYLASLDDGEKEEAAITFYRVMIVSSSAPRVMHSLARGGHKDQDPPVSSQVVIRIQQPNLRPLVCRYDATTISRYKQSIHKSRRLY